MPMPPASLAEDRPQAPQGRVDRSRDELDRHIARQADRSRGVLERPWLLDAGLTPKELRTRLRRQWLRATAYDGVYVLGHRAHVPGQREAIALAGSGPKAALARETSAAWQRLVEPQRAAPVHLVVPRARGAEVPGVVRSTAALPPEDVWVVDGLRCTTPERTVMDLPAPLLRQGLQALMRRAIAVEPLVARMHGRRGVRRFRREVEQLVPQLAHTMSELEARFVRLCRRFGLPLPVVNGTLVGADLLDCAWPGTRLVVELDGRRWHAHRDREDAERFRRRVLEGRVPMRFGWWDVVDHERRTAGEVGRGLRL